MQIQQRNPAAQIRIKLILYYCAIPRLNHILRTLPPHLVRTLAVAHDVSIVTTFCKLFGIANSWDWDAHLHGIQHGTWVLQAQLPLRLGGMGLRNSERTSTAAYWASWADVLPGLVRKFPALGRNILHHLTAAQMGMQSGPQCLVAAERAGQHLDTNGWGDRLTWTNLAAGERPPEPPEAVNLGEWRHGWQFWASDVLERQGHAELLRTLALPSTRRNAASAGKARIYSCTGPFAAIWILVCPTTDMLTMADETVL